MINEELQRQQSADFGAVIKKLFPDVPVINAEEERKRFEAEQKTKELLARVSELGDGY